MIFCDLEKIYRERNISNKYILTLMVSARARQLSEQKGRLVAEDTGEKFITRALRNVQEGRVEFRFLEPPAKTPGSGHVVVED